MGNVDIVLDGEITADRYGFHRSGTSEQWREQVAVPLAGNSNVVLAVGSFLAAPLLRWPMNGWWISFPRPSKTARR